MHKGGPLVCFTLLGSNHAVRKCCACGERVVQLQEMGETQRDQNADAADLRTTNTAAQAQLVATFGVPGQCNDKSLQKGQKFGRGAADLLVKTKKGTPGWARDEYLGKGIPAAVQID